WDVLGGGTELNAPGVNLLNPRSRELLDVFGVRAILLPPSALRSPALTSRPPLSGTRIAYAGLGGVVLSNPQALPPAFVAYNWRRSSGRNASALLVAAGTARQARDEPVIETDQASPRGAAPPATPARVVSRSDTEVTLEVRTRAAGQLVLLDAFYPGWRAQVDGHDEPIHAADVAFRAVALGPGIHKVRFYYRPASVIVGGVISIVSLLVIIACLIGGGRRLRRRRLRRAYNIPISELSPTMKR